MQWRNNTQRYGLVTRWLHFIILFLICAQIIIALCMENMQGAVVGQLYFIHKSIGLTMLLLGPLFFIWRLFNPRPALPPQMPGWQCLLASIVQWSLMILLIILPLSGWLISSASGYASSFWGWFSIKAPIAKDPSLAGWFDTVHSVGAWILVSLALLHIAAALKHWLINRDGVFQQMW